MAATAEPAEKPSPIGIRPAAVDHKDNEKSFD